uniref:Variant surface glycoprotein 1117 n=1 Tax=Trypanosoma brucei TaxID=5691 RepID=M4SZC5_9TRYP|nr:variant surface glycoprotein 1117 [Trypanosoma brucei]
MHSTQIVAFAAALIVGSTETSEAAVTAGDNAIAGRSLCPALALGDDPETFTPAIDPGPQAPERLYKLNMSLAPKEWRERFKPKGSGTTKTPAEKPSTGIPKEWQNKWDIWARAELQLELQNGGQSLKDALGMGVLTESQTRKLRPKIAAIADAAADIYAEFKSQQAARQKTDEDLKAQLLSAIYGPRQKYETANEGSGLYKGGKGTYAQVCGGGSGKDPTLTLAATFACVCAAANGQGTKKPCGHDGDGSEAWEAGGIVSTATWAKIRLICPTRTKGPISRTSIETAIMKARLAITSKSNDAYIGRPDTGTCDGDGNGACVKIKNGSPEGKLDQKQVLWLQALADIARELEGREAANRQAEAARYQLRQLEKLAETTTKLAHLLPSETAEQTGPKTGQAAKAAKPKDCTTITNPTQCREQHPKCEWKGKNDEDGEHCQLNATHVGRQATQPGTGDEATTTTTDKCKGKEEKDCKDGCQ